MKLEARAVGITAGSREVPGRKGMWQETDVSNNNNNNNNNNKVIHQKLAEAAEMIEDKSPYYKYTPANVL